MFLGETEPVSTQASAQYLLRRIAARAGLGVWRHRGGVLLSAVVSVALGGYVALTWTVPDGDTRVALTPPSPALRAASPRGRGGKTTSRRAPRRPLCDQLCRGRGSRRRR